MKFEINGQEIGFSHGLYFIGKAQEVFKKDLFELVGTLGSNTLSFLPDLMYLSLKVDAELDDKEPKISKREFIEWIETTKDLANDKGLGAKFVSEFTKSIKSNLPEEKVEAEEDVKKK